MKRNKALYATLTAISVLCAARFLTVEPATDGTAILSIMFVCLAFGFVVLFSLECDKINKK